MFSIVNDLEADGYVRRIPSGAATATSWTRAGRCGTRSSACHSVGELLGVLDGGDAGTSNGTSVTP